MIAYPIDDIVFIREKTGGIHSECAYLVLWIHLPPYPDVIAYAIITMY